MIFEFSPGYGVDRSGSVYSRRPINGKGPLQTEWRRLKPMLASDGRYLQVAIGRRRRSIHRIVAEAFHGPPPIGTEVAHRNGDGHDNRARNLQYRTHRENEAMKQSHGTSGRGERNSAAVLTESDVREIRRRAKSGSRGTKAALAREHGVCAATITAIIQCRQWRHVRP